MLITTKSNTELNHFHHRTGAPSFDDVAWLAGTLLAVFFGRLQPVVNPLRSIWIAASQAVAGEIDAMGVVNEAIEDGVSICRIAEHGAMPQ